MPRCVVRDVGQELSALTVECGMRGQVVSYGARFAHLGQAVLDCPHNILFLVRHLRGECHAERSLRPHGSRLTRRRDLQVPSNIFLKRLRPSIWLSLLMFLWGIMMVRLAYLLFHIHPISSFRTCRPSKAWCTTMVVSSVSLSSLLRLGYVRSRSRSTNNLQRYLLPQACGGSSACSKPASSLV